MKTCVAPQARGFTLLEVLVALVILAGGLLALAKFQGTLMQDNAISKQRTEATMLAQQKIEVLRAYSVMSTYSGMAESYETVNGTSAAFTRSWTITKHTATDAPQYTTITVNVSWTTGGSTQTYSLTTNIAANDPLNTGQLIATTTAVPATTSSSSSTSSSSTSTSSSSNTSSSSSTSSSSATSSSSTPSSSAITSSSSSACVTTITGATQKNNDSVSSSPSGSCTNDKTSYTCTVTANSGSSITLTEAHGSSTYKKTVTANCGNVTQDM